MRYFLIIWFILLFCYPCSNALAKSHRQNFLLAKELMAQKLYGVAYEKLDDISKDYELYDYVLLNKYHCLTQIGELKKAEEVLNIFIENYKGYPTFKEAYKNLLNLIEEPNKKLKLIEDYLKVYPEDKNIIFEKANILKKIDESEAKILFKKLFLEGGTKTILAYREIEDFLSVDEIYHTALKMLKNNDLQAIELIKKLDEKNPKVRYLYGLYHFKRKDYKRAIEYLNKLNFEESEKILALCYLRSRDYENFINLVNNFIEKKQNGIYDLVYALAEYKRRQKEYESANYYLNFLLQAYPERSGDTIFGLAWLNIRNGKYERAKELLESILESNEVNNKDKYYFWLGKIEQYMGSKGGIYFEKLSDKEGFYYLRLFPYDGILSDRENKKNNFLPEKVSKILKRLEELEAVNMKKEGKEEIKFFYNDLEKFPDILAKHLLKFENYHKLVKLGTKEGIIYYKYPFPYRDYIITYSKSIGVDPLIIASIMREESHFNSQIVSEAGALGLMQLMPLTAKKVGNVQNKSDLFKEELNIYIGIKYFGELLKKYGKIEYAIAAYNAGENAVDSWLKNDYKDVDEFIEDIPYTETRNYVKKVLRTYYLMRNLYKVNSSEMADAS